MGVGTNECAFEETLEGEKCGKQRKKEKTAQTVNMNSVYTAAVEKILHFMKCPLGSVVVYINVVVVFLCNNIHS